MENWQEVQLRMADDAVVVFREHAQAGVAAPLPPLGFVAGLKYLLCTMSPRTNFLERVSNGFWFLIATEGESVAGLFARFRDHPAGRQILASRPAFVERLRDHAALAATPPGSLGNSYFRFLDDHGLTDVVRDQEVTALSRAMGESEDLRWFRRREGAMHDLRHLLTGYGPNSIGELCLICFRYAQSHHRGLLVFIVLSALRECFRSPRTLLAMREAYRRGRAAPLLDLCQWEDSLAEPLNEHRRKLGLEPPVHYRWPAAA
jgi:ubiquinone biosynthesis protein COQ4